jgi:hypothetical protein
MSTPQVSGSANWTYTQSQIINAAYRKIGIGVDGSTVTSTQITNAQEALNNLIFSLYAQGMPVWAMTTTYFLPTQGQNYYPVGLGVGTGNLNITAPLKITQAWNLDVSNPLTPYRIPMNIYTQYNYNLLNAPTIQGFPVHLWYQPQNQQGQIAIWPAPDSYTASNRQIWFVYQRPFDQFNLTTDTPDFPQVWIEPLVYSLAHRLGPEFGIPLSERDKLNEEANALIQNALSFGTEEGALFIQPDWVIMGMGGGNPDGY